MKTVIKFLIAIVLVCYSCKNSEVDREDPVLPVLKVLDISEGGIDTTFRATIERVGNSEILEQGFCIGTSPNPTLKDRCFVADLSENSRTFMANFSGLKDQQKYFVRAYVKTLDGVVYSEATSFVWLNELAKTIVLVDSYSFRNKENFDQKWNLLYPWGQDHNGSARMYPEQVSLKGKGVLELKADIIDEWEGFSELDPYLSIRYHSGAIHLKDEIRVTEELPEWEISGEFTVPTHAGTWPAFWITGSENWPPESDIMEFKGDNTVWQNTVTGKDWQSTKWQVRTTPVENAENWHQYKVIIKRKSKTDVSLDYYIDGKKIVTHVADFMNKPFWLIINLQMESSWAALGTGPDHAVMQAKNIYVAAKKK